MGECRTRAISLIVNERRLTVAPRLDETLAETLRRCGFTDVKQGCGEGACGACTVVVGGRAVPSCLLLTASCDGARIVTASGLTGDPLARRIGDALSQSGAVQCGFCTSGILLAAWGLFSRTPSPDPEAIRAELAGNLCRCGGYQLIVDALTSLA